MYVLSAVVKEDQEAQALLANVITWYDTTY